MSNLKSLLRNECVVLPKNLPFRIRKLVLKVFYNLRNYSASPSVSMTSTVPQYKRGLFPGATGMSFL